MLTELSVSLFSVLLLPYLHNKVYTLFLYFSFLQTGFCNLLIFSLTNKFPSFDSSTCFIRRRCKFQFCFALVAFLFYYSSSLQLFGLFFIHSNTVKSCYHVVSSQKILYFFSKKKSCNAVSGLISQAQR